MKSRCTKILRAAQDDTQGCYDSLLNGDYTAETTEDYGPEIPNLPYPCHLGQRNEKEY